MWDSIDGNQPMFFLLKVIPEDQIQMKRVLSATRIICDSASAHFPGMGIQVYVEKMEQINAHTENKGIFFFQLNGKKLIPQLILKN